MTVPSRVGTDVEDIHEPSEANWSTKNINYTVPATATMLYVTAAVHAPNDPITSLNWDEAGVDELLTLVDQTTNSGNPGDVTNYKWALVSPTAKAALLTLHVASGDVNVSAILVTSYKDTNVVSVAVATNFINEDVDNDATDNTNVIASGGSAGNLLVGASAWHQNTENSPVSLSGGWGGVAELAGTEANSVLLRVAEREGPSGITFTSNNTNENAGHIVEIVAAPVAGTRRYRISAY